MSAFERTVKSHWLLGGRVGYEQSGPRSVCCYLFGRVVEVTALPRVGDNVRIVEIATWRSTL